MCCTYHGRTGASLGFALNCNASNKYPKNDSDIECPNDDDCTCPHDCDESDMDGASCKCDDDAEFPVLPIIVGTFVAVLIFLFWYRQIRKLCRKYRYNGTLHPHMMDEPEPPPEPSRPEPPNLPDTAWDAPPPYDELTKTDAEAFLPAVSVSTTDNPPSYNEVLEMDVGARQAALSFLSQPDEPPRKPHLPSKVMSQEEN